MPVDVVSGALFTAAHDLEIWPATIPLVFRRSYSTARLGLPISALGLGWTHRFDARLIRDLEGFRFFGHDGVEAGFYATEELLDAGSGALSLSNFMELRREVGRYAVWHWHGWQGPLEKFMFDASQADVMRLASIELPSGHGLLLGYDGKGRLSRIEQNVERRIALLEYNGAGLIERLRLAWAGETAPLTIARYFYDDRSCLTRVVDANGGATSYEYDHVGRLISETGPTGWQVIMKYDSEGRCIELGAPSGYQRRSFRYLAAERATVVTDSLGQSVLYRYSEAGRVQKTVHPNGAVTAKEFDELGRTVKVSGPGTPEGNETGYVYDERGDVVEVEYAGGMRRNLEYNDAHQVTAIHDITGGVWRVQYSGGAVVSVTNPIGEQTQYKYDTFNLLSEIDTPWGNRVRFAHDDIWSYERQEDGYGLVISYKYDIRLNITRVANADGEVGRFEYDVLGRLVRHITPDGASRSIRWTAGRKIAEYTTGNGGIERLEWSPEMLCLRRTDANGYTYSCEYDREGRPTAVVNPKSERAVFVWDCFGRVVSQTFFDSRTQKWEYDLKGQCTAVVRPDGTRLDIKSNDAGKVVEVTANGKSLLRYAYDEAGQVIGGETADGVVSREYDLLARVVKEVQHGRTIEYTYDNHGAVVTREFDGGVAGRLQLDYDLRGRLIGLGDKTGVLQRWEYNRRDLVTRRVFANISERFEYNYAGRPVKQEIGGAGLQTIVRTYQYDLDQNLLSIACSDNRTSSYSYDLSERLVTTEDLGHTREHCVYDSTGNLIQRDGVTLEYGPGDVLVRIGTIRLDRDANGNLLHEIGSAGRICYRWDPLGQLKAVQHSDGRITSYGYDAFGRRLFKEREGGRTDYFWAGDDLFCERSAEAVTEYAVDQFWPHAIWRDGEPQHVVVSPAGRIYEIFDRRGCLVWSGAYDAWGTLVKESGAVSAAPLRLPGQYWDAETGFHYNRFRYYDPRSMSFISPDPAGFIGGANLFLYAPNPVTYEDPLGLKCNIPAGKQAVYVLTKGQPPVVVYVGITDDPHTRVSGHKGAGKDFDNMRVIAVADNYRGARNIEGNLLHGIHQGDVTHVAGMPVRPSDQGGLQNGVRPSSGGYYHSYVPDPDNPGKSTRGHPILDGPTLGTMTDNNRPPIPKPA